MTAQPISNQHIIDCLNTHYGIKTVKLTSLPIGADINASVYKAETNNPSSYFIKLSRGHHHDTRITIITFLDDAGIQNLISPIRAIDGQPTQHLDDFTLTVFPFIEGQDGFSRDLNDDQWITLGKVMREIHEIDVPPSIQRLVRREDFSPRWREAVRSLYTHIESKLSTDDISSKLMIFMKEHAVVIHRIVGRAEELAKQLQDNVPKFVLCHSDIHGGNVLMDNKDAIYIVDWDNPIMAPKERDLMFIGGGVANIWNKPHEEKLYFKGYGKTEIDIISLAYYRYERIVEDIAELGQHLLLNSVEGHNRSEAYKHFLAQFEPGGVVEIAFKTDENLE